MDDSLNTAKARIRAAFESGIRMTTAQETASAKPSISAKMYRSSKARDSTYKAIGTKRTGGVGKPTTTNTRCRRKGHA